HTYFQVREDGQQLYGFVDSLDLEAFESLLGVSGVGPKVALAVLSVLNYRQLQQVLASDNLSALTNISGVGKKTAQRLLLELKDKLAKGLTGEQGGLSGENPGSVTGVTLPATSAGDAAEALEALGYQRQQARNLVDKALEMLGPEAAVEDLVRTALKALAKA
ncbi:MAG TPA: Holliday junction branch migration protein RuvA, partial [Bacillota bacterium]|nr:Holliday junction branch migration protein RuvA [Bacillota bacterium]